MTGLKKIKHLRPCKEAVSWVGNRGIKKMISECPEPEWLLWIASKIGISKRKIVLVKALCVKTIVSFTKRQVCIDAIESAIKYGNGDLSDEELTEIQKTIDAIELSYMDNSYAVEAVSKCCLIDECFSEYDNTIICCLDAAYKNEYSIAYDRFYGIYFEGPGRISDLLATSAKNAKKGELLEIIKSVLLEDIIRKLYKIKC